MPINRALVDVSNTAPAPWVLYAHTVLLRAVGQGDTASIEAWVSWAGGGTFRFFPPTETLLSGFCLITDSIVGIGVFEGTRSIRQLIGQVAGSVMTNDPAIPARVSSFDRVYADAVMAQAANSIPSSLQNAPVLITGHSLGGAIATIFAARRVNGNFTDVRLLTFGQPRVGDLSLAGRLPSNYVRVVNDGDTVPGVPPRGNALGVFPLIGPLPFQFLEYQHFGNAFLLTTNSLQPTTDQDTGTDLAEMAASLGVNPQFQESITQHHLIPIYVAALYNLRSTFPETPDLGPVVAINNTLSGLPPPNPNPATLPINPPLPDQASVATPGFVPTPYPGSLPVELRGQQVQSVQAATTVVAPQNTTPIFVGVLENMAITKLTVYYQQLQQGFQEQYYCQANTVSACNLLAVPLINALMAFRGHNTSVVGYRISLVNVPLGFPRFRTAQNFLPLPAWSKGGWMPQLADTAPGAWSDMFSVCVLMKCTPGTAGVSQKNIFMRGFPDDYDVSGGQISSQLWQYFGTPLVAALQRALSAGASAFGWLGTIRPAAPAVFQSMISAVTQNANGTVSVTLRTALTTYPANAAGNQNLFFPIRLSSFGVPANLNGVQTVSVNGAGLVLTTKKRIAIGQWDGQTGNVTYIPKTFIPFSATIIQAPVQGNVTTYGNLYASRIGERKAGRVFGTVPGRKRNRVRA